MSEEYMLPKKPLLNYMSLALLLSKNEIPSETGSIIIKDILNNKEIYEYALNKIYYEDQENNSSGEFIVLSKNENSKKQFEYIQEASDLVVFCKNVSKKMFNQYDIRITDHKRLIDFHAKIFGRHYESSLPAGVDMLDLFIEKYTRGTNSNYPYPKFSMPTWRPNLEIGRAHV